METWVRLNFLIFQLFFVCCVGQLMLRVLEESNMNQVVSFWRHYLRFVLYATVLYSTVPSKYFPKHLRFHDTWMCFVMIWRQLLVYGINRNGFDCPNICFQHETRVETQLQDCHVSCNHLNREWCHCNVINFLKYHHKRHPIAHPLGWDMGCFLWVQIINSSLITAVMYVTSSCNGPHYNSTRLYCEIPLSY